MRKPLAIKKCYGRRDRGTDTARCRAARDTKKKQCVKPVIATLVVIVVVLFCNWQRSWTYIWQQDHGKKNKRDIIGTDKAWLKIYIMMK